MRLSLMFVSMMLAGALAVAEEPSSVELDFPVIDAPFNFLGNGYLAPSMRQSLAVSTDFYEATHRALTGPDPNPKWRIWLVAGFDLLSEYIPFGSAWAHEEWHRAVMSRRGISSYDDIYGFPIGASVISVSHVADEDLIRLKHDYPAEQARLSAAGMEAQIEQNWLMDRHHFFQDRYTYDHILMAVNDISVSAYLFECASSGGDRTTDQQNQADGADISKRDFTGLDCTAWVYDLFRPNEPYAARGTHPSGVGINRYIHYSDLSPEERRFLRLQGYLSVLNLADPYLIRIDRFHGAWFGRSVEWNARLSHELTSFGYTVDAGLFLRWADRQFLLRLHNGFNDVAYFPGFTLEWVDQPVGHGFSLTSHATLWNQPQGQYVLAKGGSLLAAGGVELDLRLNHDTRPYVGIEAKTPGWLAGNVFLDRDLTVWTGIKVGIF
jgi:hypothetical protein